MTLVVLFLVMVAALALAAFCAGSETGFLSVSRGRILHLVREGSARAKIVQRALSDMQRTTTSLLVGNNLANVIYSSASAALSERLYPDSSVSRAAWGFFAAFAVLYLSEFMPKLLMSARPLRRILRVSPVYRVFDAAFSPLTSFALALTGLFLRREPARRRETTADLIRILQDRKDGVKVTDFESALISRILVLRRKGEPITVEALLKAVDEVE